MISRRRPFHRSVLVLYNAIFLAVFLLYSPVLLWRMVLDRRIRRGIRQRIGRVAPRAGRGPAFWIHGVSVGEVKAAGPLIEALDRTFPDHEIVVSSTTPAGLELAQKLHPGRTVIYFPLDFGPFPARALDRIRPACVLLVELELWPGFLAAAERRGIPVIVVNGRISERSFRGYGKVRRLLPQLDLIQLFCVQNQTYADRLISLQVPPERVVVTGNMKFDGVRVRARVRPDPELATLLSIRPGEKVVVGGSTHGDEERILHEAAELARKRTGLAIRLIVAPRHPERTAAVLDSIASARGVAVTLSKLRSGAARADDPRTALVVDTIGELERFYELADVVFVGGSLVDHGGQNMLEPAALGKPTLFGPHIQNFRADVDLLLAGEGVRMVRDRAELLHEICAWLCDPKGAAELGARALAVIAENQGATARTLAQVRGKLPPVRAG